MQVSFKMAAGWSGACDGRGLTGLVEHHIGPALTRVGLTAFTLLLSSPRPTCLSASSIHSEGSIFPDVLAGRREDPIGSGPLAGLWGCERLGGAFR